MRDLDGIRLASYTLATRPAAAGNARKLIWVSDAAEGSKTQLSDGASWDPASGAPLVSPAFAGDPTAPTAPLSGRDSSIATTAFVQRELDARISGGAGALLVETFDSLAAWTHVDPAPLPYAAGGVLRMPDTGVHRMLVSALAGVNDLQAQIKVTPGSDGANQSNDTRIMMRYIDPANYLMLRVSGGTGNWNIEIFKRVDGFNTQLAVGTGAVVVAGRPIWLACRVWRDLFRVEQYDGPPSLGFKEAVSRSYVLTAAELALFGTGAVGLEITDTAANSSSWDNFIVVSPGLA